MIRAAFGFFITSVSWQNVVYCEVLDGRSQYVTPGL